MSSTTTITATGKFQVENGQIISPTGTVFTAKGINLYDSQMGNAAQVLAAFPGLNFVRLNVYNYQSPSAYAAFIQTMTAAGVVVELEDHTNSTGSNAGGGSGSAFTGSQLAAESAWYAAVASAYASNPYVWFGTNNEPPEAGLTSWEQSTYTAIRNTGNTSPIMLELPGGGQSGQTIGSYGMTASAYASMTNIVIDAHYYGWDSNYSTDQAAVSNALTSLVQGTSALVSANGVVPVIIGEYGPSTNGTTTDANGSQVETAVQTSTATSGSIAWGWNSGQNDNLTDGSGNLTSYGQEVENYFASTITKPVITPSANDTVVKLGSSAVITDASGNTWGVNTSGVVLVNGVADTTTAGVIELAYVNGTIWQENSSALWWGKSSTTAAWSPTAGSATSPLPVPVVSSANDTVVKAGSTAAITDASGNKWTLTSTHQVAVNGVADTTTSGVTQLAYVNGTVWQENSSNMWWGKTSTTAAWSPTAGSATSPLPVTFTASANDATVTAGAATAIIDANGNKWTITSAYQVALNGAADTTTASIVKLAYVGGAVWMETASGLWSDKTSTIATWSTATSISPLPVTASANDTLVLAGATNAIVDASGNKWTITSTGAVAVNGVTDATTANVTELAYVNGTIWQENSKNLWWGKTTTTAAWSPTMGTATSPLPAAVVITPGSTSATVTQSTISVAATSGNNIMFVSGANDLISLTGGTNTVTETGTGNTYVLPAAGKGMVSFTSNILAIGDTLDLKTALAATNWNGVAGTLPGYLTVTDSTKGAMISIAATSGGTAVPIANITGATSLTYLTLLQHAIT